VSSNCGHDGYRSRSDDSESELVDASGTVSLTRPLQSSHPPGGRGTRSLRCLTRADRGPGGVGRRTSKFSGPCELEHRRSRLQVAVPGRFGRVSRMRPQENLKGEVTAGYLSFPEGISPFPCPGRFGGELLRSSLDEARLSHWNMAD
jgi:hypothetical protein